MNVGRSNLSIVSSLREGWSGGVGTALPRSRQRGRTVMSMRVLLTGAEIGLVESETVEPDPVNTGVGN